MTDYSTALEAKDTTIRALAAALNTACDALSDISIVDETDGDIDEIIFFAETVNEEIIESLIAQGIDKDLLPNI
jgi:hypothetical protein